MKKKNENVDINKKVVSLKFMGLMAALALTLVSFEWKSFDQPEVVIYEDPFDLITVEIVPPVLPEPKPDKAVVIVQKERKIVFETVVDSTIIDTAYVARVEPVEPIIEPPTITKRFVPPTDPIEFPDEPAEFPGGVKALYEFLAEETDYPDIALENGIQGKVYVKFVVSKTGDISNVKILEDIGGGCGAEVIRVVKKSPKWKPGTVKGYKVDSYFTLPFKFIPRRN